MSLLWLQNKRNFLINFIFFISGIVLGFSQLIFFQSIIIKTSSLFFPIWLFFWILSPNLAFFILSFTKTKVKDLLNKKERYYYVVYILLFDFLILFSELSFYYLYFHNFFKNSFYSSFILLIIPIVIYYILFYFKFNIKRLFFESLGFSIPNILFVFYPEFFTFKNILLTIIYLFILVSFFIILLAFEHFKLTKRRKSYPRRPNLTYQTSSFYHLLYNLIFKRSRGINSKNQRKYISSNISFFIIFFIILVIIFVIPLLFQKINSSQFFPIEEINVPSGKLLLFKIENTTLYYVDHQFAFSNEIFNENYAILSLFLQNRKDNVKSNVLIMDINALPFFAIIKSILTSIFTILD